MKIDRAVCSTAVASLAAAAGLTGCTTAASSVPSLADVDPQITTCQIAKDPLNPFVVEWPATDRLALENQAHRGVVVVSYGGCVLKVLADCRAPGAYEDQPATPQRDFVEAKTTTELYAELPLGAARLSAELSDGYDIRLDYVVVGERRVSTEPRRLEGQCAGATHFVRSMMVGAYELNAVNRDAVGGGVSVAGVGGGARFEKANQRLAGAGTLEACERETDRKACGAILRLSLAPLSPGPTTPSSAAARVGFGVDVGALQAIEAVGAVEAAVPTASFGAVDIRRRQLIGRARRAETDDALTYLERAQAWGALGDYLGDDPLGADARERAGRWRVHNRQVCAREGQLRQIRNKRDADRRKLSALLALGPLEATDEEKQAWKQAYEDAYRPWSAVLAAERDPQADCRPDGMVRVAAGRFFMGCNLDVDSACDPDEQPGRKVSVPTFYIDRTEVTVAQFRSCVQAGGCSRTGLDERTGPMCNWGRSDRDDHPINCVTWSEAERFCGWAQKRLPTEAEWEKAARGDDGRTYTTGNSISCRQAVFDDRRVKRGSEPVNGCGRGSTWPVGSRPAGDSPYGAADMTGNVWEWTADWYEPGVTRIARGGSWIHDAVHARVSNRYRIDPNAYYNDVGFRCAQTP